MEPKDRLFVALDFREIRDVKQMAKCLQDVSPHFKIGSLLLPIVSDHVDFTKHEPFFADCKWLDTPDTLRQIGTSLILDLGSAMCTVHARGGIQMMRALREGVEEGIGKMRDTDQWQDEWRTKLIAVTVLSSESRSTKRVLEYASDALRAGMDGVTCPPYAIRAVRKRFGDQLLIVVPGIRFRKSNRDNHRVVAAPFEAIRDGADYIVIGRPITQAKDPVAVARRAIRQIERGLRERIKS